MKGTVVAAVVAAALVAAIAISIGQAEGAEEGVAESETKGARVTAQRGATEVLLPEAARWVATQIEAIYTGGTELRTGRRSYLDIHFDMANSFRIKANTQVRVDKVLETGEDDSGRIVRLVELEVIDGEVNARLGRLPDDVRVNVTSPSAVAGATGTGFTFIHNKLEKDTTVKVVHDSVVVSARDRADKRVTVEALQEVEIRPWADGILKAKGRAVLSEADWDPELDGAEMKLTAVGTAAAPEDVTGQQQRRAESQAAATDAARSALTDLVLQLVIDESMTVGDVLAEDDALAQKVYALIGDAEALGPTFTADDACTVVVQADLAALAEALGREFAESVRGVREITEADYIKAFGDEALEKTTDAAESDGKRRLRDKLNESVIARGRTLGDEADRNANVRATILGVIENAVVEEGHYYSDGSVMLLMRCMLGRIVENHPEIVGALYMSSPRPVVLNDFMDYRFMREHLSGARGDGTVQTQGSVAKAIVKRLGLENQMDSDATDQEYANFLAAMGAFPIGGWDVGAPADEELLAVVLIKLLGLFPDVENPDNPLDYLALLKERGLSLGSVRSILGNTEVTNPLMQVVGTTPLSGLYTNNVSSVRGF